MPCCDNASLTGPARRQLTISTLCWLHVGDAACKGKQHRASSERAGLRTQVKSSVHQILQGSDDLEEAMSERLQELPPPQGRHASPKSDAEGFSFPQDMDTDAAAPSQVNLHITHLTWQILQYLPCRHASKRKKSKCFATMRYREA